jgi:hypothetical protein
MWSLPPVGFEAEWEIALRPTETVEFFGDNALSFGLGTFLFQLTGVVIA